MPRIMVTGSSTDEPIVGRKPEPISRKRFGNGEILVAQDDLRGPRKANIPARVTMKAGMPK